MRVAAFIPARSGSKRIPGKNLQTVGNLSLLQRAMAAAHEVSFDGSDMSIVVSTDDDEIARHAMSFARRRVSLVCDVDASTSEADVERAAIDEGFSIHRRPAPLASDHAQIESAIAHWWVRLETKPDVVVLLQPTSPFRTAEHVKAALALLTETGADSVVGVTASHDSYFTGRLKPRETFAFDAPTRRVRFDEWQPFSPFGSDRPRTQDLPPRGVENGSLYVTRRAAWEASGLRTSGFTVALPMTWIEGLDVDTSADLAAARALAEGMGL